MAIEHGLMVLGWHENVASDEVPPEHLWEDAEGIEQWWKYVEEKRSDGRSDSSTSTRLNRSSEPGEDEDPGDGMAENDLARFLKQS